MQGKVLKLVTSTSEIIVENIDEYVCGFSYIYIRDLDGITQSFTRQNILSAYRRLPTGDFRQIHLKKPKIYEEKNSEE